ncbi:MAG: SusD/RagB family nutrient-binding outer membrane lipoprotein [Mediterranea sp.]|jgi:hypothetical protein|nr:SusD/RagB family nutrient-binding outer membrane lipoprotein [Mediterranea sp.]
MKKSKRLSIIAIAAACMTQSCTGNFLDYNTDKNQVTGDELERGGYNVGSALMSIESYVVPVGLYLNQFVEWLCGGAYSGYWGADQEWGGKFSTYNAPPDWNLSPFNDVIGGFYPSYDLLKTVTNDPVVLAIGDICRVASMQRVTDMIGPIPYTQMRSNANGDNEVNSDGQFKGTMFAAPYDSQEDVYKALLTDLNAAIDQLMKNRLAETAWFAKYDKVYNGDVENWIRFANSLKLRMAIRMSYVAPELARQTAEEAVSQPIGVITANSQNAIRQVDTNPMYTMAIGSWKQMKAGADLISYMSGYNDPRLPIYFTPCTYKEHETEYAGIRNGIAISIKYPETSDPTFTKTTPMPWFTASEVAFLKAEGVLRGWSMGGSTAGELYNKGITLSFEQDGLSGATDYLNNETLKPAAYNCWNTSIPGYAALGFAPQSDITIKWNDKDTDEKKLERIITQKWIAIYPLSNEAWAEFRRTGYPKLAPIVDNRSGGMVPQGEFPKRILFSTTEYQNNTQNVEKAIGLLGGPDTQNTKLWWDAKNN